jgi:hypothetical protein
VSGLDVVLELWNGMLFGALKIWALNQPIWTSELVNQSFAFGQNSWAAEFVELTWQRKSGK